MFEGKLSGMFVNLGVLVNGCCGFLNFGVV